MIMYVKKVNKVNIEPACPARLAAARLRRACWGPILAPPPVRAIQTSILLESKHREPQIVLDCEENLVYKGVNYWLVLTRTLVAGFDGSSANLVKLHENKVPIIKGYIH
jgi:hypothetical protein